MLYNISSKHLSVVISDRGAELQSIKDRDGREYLWQGDPAFWSDRSPNLFPYIGRMIDKQYEYAGKTYSMDIHGFALSMDFEVVKHTDSQVVFQLRSTPDTRMQYPWEFAFSICYEVCENSLHVTFKVENRDSSTMLFAVGGHPGFRVPVENEESFEDYRLRFPAPSAPERILFSSDCFVEKNTAAYLLNQDNSIPLRHDLFDEDAIVLKNSGHTVILESAKSQRAIEVSYPQMDYIGFWHMPKMDAPYICIEPWSSLPSAVGSKTVWDSQADLLKLSAGDVYLNHWSLRIY